MIVANPTLSYQQIAGLLGCSRWLIYRVAWLLTQGVVPNKESALTKAYATEQEICDVLREVFGTYTDPAEF